MPRAKILGFIACIFSLAAGAFFFYFVFAGLDFSTLSSISDLKELDFYTYYVMSIPIGLVALGILGTGCWIGWTILTIKVAPPMPEIVEKNDYAKVKAFFLCLLTLLLSCFFVYGIYIRSYWALAIPAAVVTLVILGMIFWVGLAIITTRATLPEDKK